MRSDVFADDVWFVFGSAVGPAAAPRVAEGEAWWSQTGSNRRPHACKARALPAELWPRNHSKRSAPVVALSGYAGHASLYRLAWLRHA
jgi:hypothetical protein